MKFSNPYELESTGARSWYRLGLTLALCLIDPNLNDYLATYICRPVYRPNRAYTSKLNGRTYTDYNDPLPYDYRSRIGNKRDIGL